MVCSCNRNSGDLPFAGEEDWMVKYLDTTESSLGDLTSASTTESSTLPVDHLHARHPVQHSSVAGEPDFVQLVALSDLDFYCLDQNILPATFNDGRRVTSSLSYASTGEHAAWTHSLPSTASTPEHNSVVETTRILNPGSNATHIAPSSTTYCSQGVPRPIVSTDGCAEPEMASGRGRTRKRKQSSCQTPYQCPWNGCGCFFATKGLLKRHVDTQHIRPGSFICPECGRLFNRRDNMTEHLGRVHWKRISRR